MSRKKRVLIVLGIVVFLMAGFEAWHAVLKPLPEGIPYAGGAYPADEVRFLHDVTYMDSTGTRQTRQEIFDEVMSMVSDARKLVLMDMFLYNDFQGPKPELTRGLSQELTDALIKRKREVPTLRAIVITDPINLVYGGMSSPQFNALKEAGVEVVVTDLMRLRDSNPIYSALWHYFARPFGNSEDGGRFKNPFGEGKVTLRSWLRMLNFKANHRKVILADSPTAPGGWAGLVTSGNPHDASSAHGNIAVWFTGPAVRDLLESELAVLRFSGHPGKEGPSLPDWPDIEGSDTNVTVLTESAIKSALLESIRRAGSGDMLDIAVFYLSDREVVRALKGASGRGARMRVLMDPNFDAFGHEKNGVPNRQVGMELSRAGVPVRWCDTHGEQCHAKMLMAAYGDGRSALIAGSANFTRRNLKDLNLETDVLVEGPANSPVFREAREYMDLVWDNRPGEIYSAGFEKYAEDSALKVLLYRVMETTGLSTF